MSKYHDKEWWSAAELAAACLPDIPTTRENCSRLIRRIGHEKPESVRARTGRGGGVECHISALPEAARDKLVQGSHCERAHFALPELPAGTFPLYFKKRMEACEVGGPRESALLFKLLIAELVVRYAQWKAVPVGHMTRHFAGCMSAGQNPFSEEDLLQQIAPPSGCNGHITRFLAHHTWMKEQQKARFIQWYVFRRIVAGTRWRPYRKPVDGISRNIRSQIFRIN
ncbi:DNA-binding protein [Xanthobacter sp. TB0139]|uniref:DNA-binding protein n=1 Tax=Xanthobacter sp. TB0139 TaxID=3459178 RepID=UPI00403912E6